MALDEEAFSEELEEGLALELEAIALLDLGDSLLEETCTALELEATSTLLLAGTGAALELDETATLLDTGATLELEARTLLEEAASTLEE